MEIKCLMFLNFFDVISMLVRSFFDVSFLFSDYFCATICFLYNYCWKPVFEICIIGKICRKNYMSIACFFASVPVTSLNQHKKLLKMSSDTTKENCPSQKASSRDGDMLKYIVSPTTPTFFLF